MHNAQRTPGMSGPPDPHLSRHPSPCLSTIPSSAHRKRRDRRSQPEDVNKSICRCRLPTLTHHCPRQLGPDPVLACLPPPSLITPQEPAVKTVGPIAIAQPPIRTGFPTHSPSTNIVGTPYPSDAEPFQYPFPDPATTAAGQPPTESFSTPYPIFTGVFGSGVQSSYSSSRLNASLPPPSDPQNMPPQPRLRPPPSTDPPVPPGLVAKRHRFSLNLLPSRASRATEGSRTDEPSTNPGGAYSLAITISRMRASDPSSAADPRNKSKSP